MKWNKLNTSRYYEFINNILKTRGRFGIQNEYKERHHIIPKCKGGLNESNNLIDLYAQEHYEEHKILFEDNINDFQLGLALDQFHYRKSSKNAPKIEVTKEEYERLKIEFANRQRKRFSGKNNPRYGKNKGKDNPM